MGGRSIVGVWVVEWDGLGGGGGGALELGLGENEAVG